MLPDDNRMFTYQTFIGAMLSMHITIIVAFFTHWLDGKSLTCQIFWIQILAVPGAYITAKFFGKMISGKEEWIWRFGMYRLVNLMLWLSLQVIPLDEKFPFPLMGWILSVFILIALDTFFLIDSIVLNFEIREAENRKAATLVTLGALIGVLLVIGVMVPLELKFHVSKDKYWAYQILAAELGALPGARLIGYSKWFARIYEYGQPGLPGYAKLNEEEPQV
jgi:hypothetical protein